MFGADAPAVKSNILMNSLVISKISNAKNLLSSLERHIESIHSQKRIAKTDNDTFARLMDDYDTAIYHAFEASMRDAQDAAKSEGKIGSMASMKEFENSIHLQQSTLNKLKSRTDEIDGSIRQGRIIIDRTILNSLSPTELEEVHRDLTPAAIKHYKGIFDNKIKPGVKPGAKLLDNDNLTNGLLSFCSMIPEKVGNFLIAPADAAVAAGCIGVCTATNFLVAPCLSCVVAASGAAYTAYQDRKRCYKECRTSWWPKGCRVGCTTIFIAILG